MEGSGKYYGIAAVGSKLYCAPCNASAVLVIDSETDRTHTIPCGAEGHSKWNGIAAVGTKLFCAPCNSSYVLVIDTEGEAEEAVLLDAAQDLVLGEVPPDALRGLARQRVELCLR